MSVGSCGACVRRCRRGDTERRGDRARRGDSGRMGDSGRCCEEAPAANCSATAACSLKPAGSDGVDRRSSCARLSEERSCDVNGLRSAKAGTSLSGGRPPTGDPHALSPEAWKAGRRRLMAYIEAN